MMENRFLILDANSETNAGHSDEINADIVDNGEYELNCGQSVDRDDGESVILGKKFPTMDAAYHWYKQYALAKGFGTRINWHSKSRKTNEIITKRYVCNKEGFKNIKDINGGQEVKRHKDTRTGCSALMEIKLTESKEWVICKFDDTHNHPLTTSSKVTKHGSHSTFNQFVACKSGIGNLSISRVRPSVVSMTVDTPIGSHEADVMPYKNKERNRNIGKECYSIIKHFQDKATSNDSYFFMVDLGEDCTLKNIFWADERSRALYTQFRDVLVFDITYKTNKLTMPFSSFVGVNHHRQPILFGGALLEDETESTFVWLFEQFLKCMHNITPLAVITDHDDAIGNAIKKVFPDARHRFCSWHIEKQAVEHLTILQAQYSNFNIKYQELIKSDTIEDFESEWESFQKTFKIEENSWFSKMYTVRNHWVKAYLKDHFFAGMTTSDRSESIYSFFDGYLNSNTMLNDFVVQYDAAVRARQETENDEDFRTMNIKTVLFSKHPIEVHASKCYTHTMFDIFQFQWKKSFGLFHEKVVKEGNVVKYRVGRITIDKKKWRNVTYESFGETFKSTCSCAKFETGGVLCKHILYVIRRKCVTVIPNDYILGRWTIDTRFKMLGVGCVPKEYETPRFTMWSIRTRFNKLLEDDRCHPNLLKKLDDFVDGVLVEVAELNRLKQIEANIVHSQVDSTTEDFVEVHDPSAPVKSKGCSKIATGTNSRLELAQQTKRKRSECSKQKAQMEECHLTQKDE